MEKELYEEIVKSLEQNKNIALETAARTFLLGELLIEKGILKEDELIAKLSVESIDKMLKESEHYGND